MNTEYLIKISFLNTMEFYSNIKKKEIKKSTNKLMELQAKPSFSQAILSDLNRII